ncbi:MAG TPA: hypothetical protein VM658_09315 [bacterium]|nr:hypothetical protein [bacterium]
MDNADCVTWRGRLLPILPALIILATLLISPRVMAQCTVFCSCTCGPYVGSENGGPFYSTSQCESYRQNAEYRCSTGGAQCWTSCSPCTNCEPEQAPQQEPPSAPEPAQPSQQDIDRANAQNIWAQKSSVPDQQAVQAAQKQIMDQMQALQKIQEQRQAAGPALTQLGCAEYLSRSAAGLFQSGDYDDAADLARQASSYAMDGKPPAVSCGNDPLARFEPPPVPAPTMVPPPDQQRIKLINDIAQNTAKLKDLSAKQDQAQKQMDEAKQAKQYWQKQVDTIKASPPKPEAPTDDIVAQAMAALQQSDDAYQDAEKSFNAAGADISSVKAGLEKDLNALNASAGQGGRP